MSTLDLGAGQNAVGTAATADANGNVTDFPVDAGSLTATLTTGTAFSVTTDGTSTVTVTATGTTPATDTLTVGGNANGVALNPATVDVVQAAGAPSQVTITFAPAT